MNPLLQKSFTAAAELDGRRIVKLTGDNQINVATAAADASIGVTWPDGADKDAEAAVITHGIAEVEASGAIVRGAWVTAAANGKGAASSTAGDNVIGRALDAAAADGDIIRVSLHLSTLAAA